VRHIAVITTHYPSFLHPNKGTFVRQLVDVLTELGLRCTVIYPWNLHRWIRERSREQSPASSSSARVPVIRPLTPSLSNRRFGTFNTYTLTYASFRRAVWKALQSLNQTPDVLYGHFLYPNGAAAVWAAQRLGRPAFVAVGEGTFWTLRPVGLRRARRDLKPMTGAIAVSSRLGRGLIEELDLSPESVAVFPNGVDRRKFHQRDRIAMRRKHGLPEDRFLVIYVGNFIEAKGVQRSAAAIEGLPGVAGIFVGSGPARPQISNLAFCGKVPHEIVPELLSAADCFVLPSDAEGSSNATLEAMTCGLPAVVSARPFNEDICDKETACLVEPEDIESIRSAILALKENPSLRRRLSEAALARSARYDIQARAQGILQWMEQRINACPSAAPETAVASISNGTCKPHNFVPGLGPDAASPAGGKHLSELQR
jgi:glycosyltransferase involved in cell wall biosynthesis